MSASSSRHPLASRPAVAPVRLEEHTSSDTELVRRAREGDRLAKQQLFMRHVRRTSAVVYRLMGHDRDLEDIVQDTFVRAFTKLDTLKEPAAFSTWLCRLATGTVIDTLRRRSLARRLGLRRNEPIDVETLVAHGTPADVAAELRAVYAVIEGFPTDERIALVLRRIEELTLDEIADYTGWSLATVKRRLGQAEQRLHAFTLREQLR